MPIEQKGNGIVAIESFLVSVNHMLPQILNV
jgi:hypothetical protein